MIIFGFVYQVMFHKNVTYHMVLFIEESCLENRRSKNINKREPLASEFDERESIKELSREPSTERS